MLQPRVQNSPRSCSSENATLPYRCAFSSSHLFTIGTGTRIPDGADIRERKIVLCMARPRP